MVLNRDATEEPFSQIVTLKLRQKLLDPKCSFNITSNQTGRGHIPAEQYPNGPGNPGSKKVRP